MARIENNKKDKLKRIISESVRKTLNEMGTYKQNAFLQRLMGNRYKPEYDKLSVGDTSALIQKELDAQKQQQNQTALATEKQIDFIQNNKYFSIPSITQVADKLTKNDAMKLITALNPYSNGGATYYGNIRQRKERWLPEMRDTVVPILEKYGLTQEAERVNSEVDAFMTKFNAKQEKMKQKREKEEMERLMNSPYTLFVVSARDEENIAEHETKSLPSEIYMDGILEDVISYDIPYLVSDMTKMSLQDIEETTRRMGIVHYPTIVLGYDKPCDTVLWYGYDIMGRVTLGGRIVDASQLSSALSFAKENKGQKHNGEKIKTD